MVKSFQALDIDFVMIVFVDIVTRTRLYVEKNVHVNFLTDLQKGRLTLSPVDSLIFLKKLWFIS